MCNLNACCFGAELRVYILEIAPEKSLILKTNLLLDFDALFYFQYF